MSDEPQQNIDPGDASLQGWLAQVRKGILSRRDFLLKLTAAGATAAGAAIILDNALKPKTTSSTKEQQNLQQHQQHITRQTSSPATPPASSGSISAPPPEVAQHVENILLDYHPDAIVDDALNGTPIQGHAAIRERKLSEALSMANPKLEITRRYAIGDQVIAEWIFTGTHVGTYKGYTATGNQIRLQGLTVVTRRDGKIVNETLYYDAAEIHQQLSAPQII